MKKDFEEAQNDFDKFIELAPDEKTVLDESIAKVKRSGELRNR